MNVALHLDRTVTNEPSAPFKSFQRSISMSFQRWDTDPMIPFPPVVEPNLPGAFISEHPRDVKTPHAISIPWMGGLTADEGAMKSARKCFLFVSF